MRVVDQIQDDGGRLTVDYRVSFTSRPDWFVTLTTENSYFYATGDSMEAAFTYLANEMSK